MNEEKKVTCPECRAKFKFDEQVEEGGLIFCPECDAELEVYSLEPPKVVAVDEEDYNEDEFEEEEEEEDFGVDDDDNL